MRNYSRTCQLFFRLPSRAWFFPFFPTLTAKTSIFIKILESSLAVFGGVKNSRVRASCRCKVSTLPRIIDEFRHNYRRKQRVYAAANR